MGDNYFINTLRALVCKSQHIERILVSQAYSNIGIYTLKFYKAGKWRYVHIDDYIPCRHSGRVQYCRNVNPNETFAMLFEKGYAKLHGCYEAIAYGLIEKSFFDTTSSFTTVLRGETYAPEDICDTVWNHLYKAQQLNQLTVCGRFVPDPYSEEHGDRKGILLDHVYQIV